MSDDRLTAWNAAIEAVYAEYDADVYFYSAAIDNSGFGRLSTAVRESKSRKNVLLILVTDGGLANSAFQIARFLQNEYEGDFSIFCPSRCKSAGTLVAIGASDLIMDTFSELGPLDVQLVKQNEIALRKSGLLARSSFDALADSAFELYERLMFGITVKSNGNVSFKLASELSATMASTMMATIYGQINPEIVGSEKRDLEVAFHYGCRLAEKSANATNHAVYRLVHDYPSHDFIIDANEARTLFHRVSYPCESLYMLVKMLGDRVYEEAIPSVVMALTPVDLEGERDEQQPDAESGDEPGAEASVADSGGADRQGDPEPAHRGGRGLPERAPRRPSGEEASEPEAGDGGAAILTIRNSE